MKSGRAALVLITLLVGLSAWDWSLSQQEDETRALRNRAGRLVPAELRELADKAAAVHLNVNGKSHLYGRIDGSWRCISFQQAPADAEALTAAWKNILEGEGILQTRDIQEANALGFDGPSVMQWTFHGTDMMVKEDKDELFGVELLAADKDGKQCLAKLKDTSHVWLIDTNPLQRLQQSQPTLPPLLDPFVVPLSWPQSGRLLKEIVVVQSGAKLAHLKQGHADVTPAEVQEGKSPYEWVLVQGDREEALDFEHVSGYASLLMNLPYQMILKPDAIDLNVSTAMVTLTLVPQDGEPLHLYLDSTNPEGVAHIRNSVEKLLFAIDPAIAKILAPGPEQLRASSDGNPWRAHLR